MDCGLSGFNDGLFWTVLDKESGLSGFKGGTFCRLQLYKILIAISDLLGYNIPVAIV